MSDINKKIKAWMIIGIVVCIIMSIFFCFMFANSLISYSRYNVDYDDLNYKEFVFDRYGIKHGGKQSEIYKIYFMGYDKPFEINRLASTKINVTELEELEKYDRVNVYYRQIKSNEYDYEICEIRHGSIIILSLTDYLGANRTNQLIGTIISPIMVALFVFLIVVCCSQLKNKHSDSGIGKIRLEYIADGNVIRVYNAVNVCSLMINGKVVNQYWGLVAVPFSLKGMVQSEGREILVEAKYGVCTMKLYYDGKCVKSKFMPLG